MKNGDSPIQLLLIEDDELTREVLTLQMTAQGYAVQIAESGVAAVQLLQQADRWFPNVVLVDLLMPGLSGVALLRQLRSIANAAFSSMMLLAMSASIPEEDLTGSYDGFLLKPFTMNQLSEALSGVSASPKDQTTSSSAEHSLDENIYKRLAGAMPAIQLDQLYALCIEDAETRIDQMRLAAASGDDSAFRKVAHTIKGGCGIVGAVELYQLAAAAEQHGIETANHVASLDEMMMACGRLRRILVAREDRASS